MKILYIQCNMGISGDMFAAALYELSEKKDFFLQTINSLENVEVTAKNDVKCGIKGTHINVFINGEEEKTDNFSQENPPNNLHIHEHERNHIQENTPHEHKHSHRNLEDIRHIIGHFPVSDKVKNDALAVYDIIAAAEAKVHDCPVDKIHFHEVGNLDAIIDIVSVCLFLEEISPDKIIVSPICVGGGNVRCAHGILPVPAPATAEILTNIPIYSGEIKSELCTPTGAALVKYFADSFGEMPVFCVEKIGIGTGTKNFPNANILRVFLADVDKKITNNSEIKDDIDKKCTEYITELSCNIDDMTPEHLSFACEILLNKGALDVFTTPVTMKKGRNGILLTCICQNDNAELFAKLIFKHTSTFGLRKNIVSRCILDRKFTEIETPYGVIREKHGTGYGVSKSKLEYEDLAKIARENDISIQEAKNYTN